MKKGKKGKSKGKSKRDNSLSSVNNIAGRELTQREKDAEKARIDALAAAEHTALEGSATLFAEQFCMIKDAADDTKQRAECVVKTTRAFVESSRSFLEGVRKFFASNKGRKVKQTLLGCLTFEEFCSTHLHCNDDYVRQIFRATDKALAFSDGAKLLRSLTEDEAAAAKKARDSAATEKKAEKKDAAEKVTRVQYGNQLALSTAKAISESFYTAAEKVDLVSQVIKELTGLVQELTLELKTITVEAAAA